MSFKDCPKVLLQKIVLTAFIGIGCLIVGVAYYLFSHDRRTLMLSLLIMAFSLVKAFGLHRIVNRKKYEVIEGTCVDVALKPFNKQYLIKMIDASGLETTLRVGKHAKIKIGFQYRFYFAQRDRISVGNEYLDTALSSDHFLAMEEL